MSRGTAGFEGAGATGASTTRGDALATTGTDDAGRDDNGCCGRMEKAGDAAAAPAALEVAPRLPAIVPE